MSFNEFLNNSSAFDEALICGNILLHAKEWEISFICDFCHRNMPNLSELLRHALSQHVKDVPPEKLQELCGIEAECFLEEEELEDQEVTEQYLPCPNELDETGKQSFENIVNFESDESLTKQADCEYIQNIRYEIINEDCVVSINKGKSNCVNENFEFFDVENETKSSTVEMLTSKTSRLICQVCSEKFSTRSQLAAHRKTHGAKPYICQRCGATFAIKGNFIEHTRRHLGIKPHACTMCEKAFTSSSELKTHQRTHTRERPYKCTKCDRRFVRCGEMTAHVRRHTNVRPYLCPHCGKTFLEAKNLNNHLATHSTERPHKCKECDAKFSTLNSLRQHWRVHASVKKYNCKLCQKKCATTRGLRLHMKRTHTNEKNQVN